MLNTRRPGRLLIGSRHLEHFRISVYQEVATGESQRLNRSDVRLAACEEVGICEGPDTNGSLGCSGSQFAAVTGDRQAQGLCRRG